MAKRFQRANIMCLKSESMIRHNLLRYEIVVNIYNSSLEIDKTKTFDYKLITGHNVQNNKRIGCTFKSFYFSVFAY